MHTINCFHKTDYSSSEVQQSNWHRQ
jgi:hypothetical protein